jgi:hypothetical protein
VKLIFLELGVHRLPFVVSNDKCDMCCVIVENFFIFIFLILLVFSCVCMYIWVHSIHFLQDVSSSMLTNFSCLLVAFDTTNM